MPDLMGESFRLIGTVWDKGNYLARVGIAIILVWPLVLIGTAFLLPPEIALTVVPIVTIACLLVILLGSSKLAIVEVGFFRYVARIIVPFLLIGVYSSFIPLLVPIVALIWYVILFLFWAGRPEWGAIVAVLLIGFSLAYFPGTLGTRQHLTGKTGDPFVVSATSDDAQLVVNIKAQMYSDPITRPAMLQVGANNGAVTLTGTVSSGAVRYEAFKIAEQSPGVSQVIDRMTVKR